MKTRSKVIRRESHEPSHEISFDLVIEIVTRLPAKSLMRFKSVSKLWSSFICSKYFTNRFLKVSSPAPRLYMWLGIDNKNVLLSSSSSDLTNMSSFVVDQDLTIPAMEGYSISHVFRGLMCFTKGQSAQIYNTTTRQLVVLPDIEESNIIAKKSKMIMYRIGHDPVHDQYKVFCTVARGSHRVGNLVSEHWVLLLGGDVSSRWRKIPIRCPPHRPSTKLSTININGSMLYYPAWASCFVLVSLDVISEEISVLQVPQDQGFPGPFFTLNIDLVEYGGRVAFLDHFGFEDEGVMKVWVMEDAGWSRKTLVLHPSELNILNMIHMFDNTSLKVRGTTRNGEVILVPENRHYGNPIGKIIIEPQETSQFYVFLYNLQKNHIRKVEIINSSNRFLTKNWDVVGLDEVDNLVYL